MADLASRLLQKGFFPETLPPCFSSINAGGEAMLRAKEFLGAKLADRSAAKPIPYSCTKHNASRRLFGTPNPLQYFYVASFLEKNWKAVDEFCCKSEFSESIPDIGDEDALRCVKITSFNELNKIVHRELSYSPFILRTDISQFYPSIYTHSLPWAFHSKLEAKKDRKRGSERVFFNELDFHLRNCQDGQTRGVLVGPDASRMVAEVVACAVDAALQKSSDKLIIGAVRHVDDYSIGVRSESDAALVLTNLREALNEFELLPNDSKTRTLSAVVPNDAAWPLELQRLSSSLLSENEISDEAVIELIDAALRAAKKFETQSPLKLVLRGVDKQNLDLRKEFGTLEPFLLRFVHHFPHTIDYIAMIVGSRVLHGEVIATESWTEVINDAVVRNSRLSHHHEVAWLLWLALMADIELAEQSLVEVVRTENAHLVSMLIGAFREKLLKKLPDLEFDSSLDMKSGNWLLYYEATLAGITKAKFENDELDFFKTLAGKGISFIDLSGAKSRLKDSDSAISDIRFGYDDDDKVDEVSSPPRVNIFHASMTEF